MRLFQLEWAKLEGIMYKRCTLSVDDAAAQVEVTHHQRKLLSSKDTSLTKFGFDAGTKVSRIGASLSVGGVELMASSLDDASAIEKLLGAPRAAAREQAFASLALSEERAKDFLTERNETLAFLSVIKSDPAEGMLQLYLSSKSPPDVALRDYLKSRENALVGSLERLDAALADLSAKAGAHVAERVYAVTYLGGLVQNNLLEKGEPGLKAEGFVSELGIQAGDISPPLEDVPVRLVDAAHDSTAALIG
jgi:hypothetical protein